MTDHVNQNQKPFLDLFNDEFVKNMIPPNVLVVGKTGVGKSTLINAMFNGNIALTGVGDPVSQHLQKYTREGIPIAIWDTRGFELGADAQVSVLKEIKTEIQQLIESGDASKQLHICWYCVNDFGNRIEPMEEQWIRELSEQMPVVLVLTQTYSLKKDEFYRAIKAKNLPIKQVIRVLAQGLEFDAGIQVAPHGLMELSQVTFQLLPEQLRNGYIAAQRVDIESKVKSAWNVAKWTIGGSGAAAALPPGADLAAIGALQVTMLARITHIFGLPMGTKFFIAVAGGIAGRVGVGALAGFVLGKLAKLTGVGYVAGVAIDSAVTVGVSTALAAAYINVCKKIATGKLEGLSEAQMLSLVEEEFKRKRDEGRDALPD